VRVHVRDFNLVGVEHCVLVLKGKKAMD